MNRSRLFALSLCLLVIAALLPACFKGKRSKASAGDGSRIGAAQAVKTARKHLGNGSVPIELELKTSPSGPSVYKVEFTRNGGLTGVTVSSEDGAILGTEEVVPSVEEEALVARLLAIPEQSRRSLGKAVKEAEGEFSGGSVVEVDLVEQLGRLTYRIKVLVGDRKEKVDIDVEKGMDKAPAAEGE